METRRKRKAFTLVEALVTIAVVGAALTLWHFVFFSGHKQTRKLSFALEAYQKAMLLRAHIQRDLDAHIPLVSPPPPRRGASALEMLCSIRGSGDGPEGACLNEDLSPQIERIVYRFDENSGYVLRNGKPLTGVGRFRKVSFSYTPPFPEQGLPEIVEVSMDIVPEDAVGKALTSRTPRRRISFRLFSEVSAFAQTYVEWHRPEGSP